jgi:Holliday junction resolvase RusA-like endonuclease
MGYPLEWLEIAEKKGLVNIASKKTQERSCVVPVPPSVNNLFVANHGNKGRHKSKKYKDWLAVAVPMFAKVAAAPVPCEVVITVLELLRSNRDLDNLCKPLLDAAVTAGALVKDSCLAVRGVSIRYDPRPDAIGVMVEFKELTR